jgi:hypothetical protein
MSYTFLQEQGEESSAECFSDIEPFVRSRLNLTAEKSSCNDSETESCLGSRSGTMCEPSTESRGEALQTLCAEGSRARTSAQQGKAQVSQVSVADCGLSLPGSLAKYDRDSHSLRIAQCSLFEGLSGCSAILPRWGTMRNGECWERQTWERHTGGTGFGFLPTHSIPTPTASDHIERKCTSKESPLNYLTNKSVSLDRFVKMWPTPTAQDAKNNGAPSQMERNTKPLNAEVGGKLNPTWVEWLMGWPLGWTDLKPLETVKCHSARQRHGVGF